MAFEHCAKEIGGRLQQFTLPSARRLVSLTAGPPLSRPPQRRTFSCPTQAAHGAAAPWLTLKVRR